MSHVPSPRRLAGFSLLLLPLGLFLTSPVGRGAPADDAVKAASAVFDGIRTETLPNGLRVYMKPIPGCGVVTTKVAYKVGAADEDLDNTGLSHYLEHLMFKGTDKIMPGDIDRLTLRNGGANNAYTGEDFTVYHFDFAADRWEPALEVEADRMRNLRIDDKHEFQQEKGAVIEELRRNEDEPWDLEYKAIAPLLFGTKGPYGHPVIGDAAHVKAATAAIIKGHYDNWYHPNNASLVIVGDFDPDRAMEKVKKLFADLPKGKLPERKKVSAEKLERPARKDIPSKFEVARLIMGFNTVDGSHADAPALAVIEAVLSNGKTARLYKKLVEGAEIAGGIGASSSTGRYPGWFAVQVEMLKGKDRAEAEKLVLAELKKLADEPVSEAELKRVRQSILASAVFARESVHGLADAIAQGVTTHDLDHLKNYLPKVMAVTPKDIQRVAKEYLQPEKRVVVWSVPGKDEKGGAGDKPVKDGARRQNRAADTPAGKGVSLEKARRVELPNGLVLLLYENRRVPIVVAQAALRHVRMYEPDDKMGVATLTGMLLDEGSTKRTGDEIAEAIENVGGSLAFSGGGGSVKVLAPDRALGLALLFESLTKPSFPKDAFNRVKAQQLSSLDEAESQPDSRARNAFLAAVYGKHPLGRPPQGTRKTVEKLTRDDLAAFHQKVFVPNNTIVAVVGDFDSKEVVAEIEKLTADWKKGELPTVEKPPVEKPRAFTQEIISMPEAAQLQFFLGHVGITRKNPDFYKLLVMDYVLGTGPGFTDRLSSRLRDREGLAYTVSANITSSADTEPGTFTCYIGTDAGNFDRVKKEFLEELHRIRDEKPTEQEVEDAKKYLLGSLPFSFTTSGGIAGQLLSVEKHGLGFGYLDEYRKGVAAVTPADVQAMAKKYIDPERLVLVAAGAIDAKTGKPLKKGASE